MGIFFEQIEFINRDCIERSITYDGQRVYVKPNYDAQGNWLPDVHNFAPKLVIPYAVNQNVVMGSEDPLDPSGFESHVVPLMRAKKSKSGKAESKYDISFLPSRGNTHKTRVVLADYLDDTSLKVVDGRGPFRASEAAVAAIPGGGIAQQHVAVD